MKKKNLFIWLAVCFIAIPALLCSQDWPQFRGSSLDCRVTGFNAPAKWPSELKQIWKINVGFGDASPVLSGKKMFLATRQGENEVVLCLDVATGNEIWKSQYATPAVTGPSGSHPGPRSTPAVSGGKVVTLGATGILNCLDVTTGKVLWKKENPGVVVPQFFTGMSPLITDGMCIVNLGTKDKGEVLALDLASGNEKWKWQGEGPAYASPSIMAIDGQKHLIVQTEKNLMSLNMADGSLLWQIPAPAQQRFYNCTSPCINGRIIYYTGQGTGTKALEVNREGNKFVTRELWSNTEIGAKWNTPVLRDGFLYGFTDQRRLYCINATTGVTAWYDNTVTSDFATLLDCGSVLIGLPSTANLIVFSPDPKNFRQVAGYKVSDTPIYAFPLISGSDIYVKDAESLILYRLE